MNYWLVKSEPSECSIDLVKQKGFTMWDGVRNYQARNHLMQMKKGDLVLFYHSVEAPVGVVGIVKVKKEFYPDPTQFDPKSDYYDPKSPKEKPRWFCPDLEFVQKFKSTITLEQLKSENKLKNMALLQKGSRLSVHKLSEFEFNFIRKLSDQ
jgi:predicted RNA-binding protein with PUA-like domain